MAVDYLSAMNVGSGLNVTQIVDALVDAEKAPREAQITENIEEKTVSDCEITPIFSSKKCPFSAIFIGADPEIPPCHTINPEYPAAPING